ncbi:MAG: PAS domain S-box protein [Acidobacteriota bacterium]
MTSRPRATVSIRATLVVIAAVIAIYVGVIGAYLVFSLAPSAALVRERASALTAEYNEVRAHAGRLRATFRDVRPMITAATIADPDRRRSEALLADVAEIGDAVKQFRRMPHAASASPAMLVALTGAEAEAARCTVELREVLVTLAAGDLAAARRAWPDADGARLAMNTLIDEAQQLAFQDMVENERLLGQQAGQVVRALGAWAGAGVLLLVAMTLLVRRRLYAPLAMLDAGMARVAHGELQTSLPIQRTDELGRLTSQFNQMTEWLRIRASDARMQAVQLAERFGRIFEHSFNDIYVFEARTLRVLQMNQGALLKLGYEASQIEGLSVLDLLQGYDEAAFRRLVEPLERDEQPGILFSAAHVRKNGTVYPVDITLQLWKMEAPPVFVAIAQDVAERRRGELIRVAAQRVAEIALSAPTLEAMFAQIHAVVGELMPARNFYLALYDEATDTISFPYFVDEEDDDVPAPKKPGRGCTEYVLRTGNALLLTSETFKDLADRGEVVLVGAPAADWLGVPLVAGGKVIGVLVVQSYGSEPRHTDADLGILQFVSTQVGMAVMRRQADQAVADRRHQLQGILDGAPFGALYYELKPDGVLVFTGANKSADRILNLDCSEYVGRTLEEIFPALASTDVPAGYRRTAAEGVPFDVDQVDYDDHHVRGAFEVHAVQTAPNHVAAFFRDITERKRAEVALQHERDLVARVMETSPAGVIVMNRDGQLSFANQAATRILGLVKSQTPTRPYDPPEWRITAFDGSPLPADHVPFERVMATRSPVFGARHAIQWPDGRRVMLMVSAAPILDQAGEVEAVVAAVEDITESIRLEEDLRRSEQQSRTLVDGARDMIFALSRDGVLTTLNPAFEEITGFTRDQWMGRPFVELLHVDDGSKALALTRGGRDEGTRHTMQLRVRSRAGGYRIGELHTTQLRDGDQVVGVLGVVRDVTDRIHLEEQMRHSQKMESIGRLAGGVAHDFNNLLTVMLGFTAQAKDGLSSHDPARADLAEVEEAGAKAAALTRQLLAFARRQVTEPRPLDLNAVTLGMDKMLRRLIGEDVQLLTRLGNQLGTVSADLGQIEQVIVNLAVNARDAMPRGGTLTIETANVLLDKAGNTHDADVPAGRYVMLAVGDTGHGMTPEVQAHIFEPFFTTKDKGKGTGLGLATCYGIVKQAGAWIWVYSEPGHGTTFKIYFPRIQAAAEALAPAVAVAPVVGHERILLVEDDEGVRKVAGRALRQRGYHVTDASNGQEAIDIVEAATAPFDLLLTDVVMPVMGGQELAGRLLKERPDLKILFTSGYTEEGIVHQGVLDRTVAFLAKPYDLVALAKKVRSTLDA